MFKINPNPTFPATVKITVPGGQPTPIEFVFKHKTRAGLAEWMQHMEGKADADLVGEYIAGWSGVFDDAGEPVPFSVDAVLKVCNGFPAAALEIYAGYIKALTESRAKN